MNENILISACLLGEPCRYDGRGKQNSRVVELLKGKNLIPVCPEVEGGLGIPRPAAEIQGKEVRRENGEAVTEEFHVGASICTKKALSAKVKEAVLKSRSPACGCGHVYDGSFSGSLTRGDGIFTQHLKSVGIQCISDEDFLAK